MAVFAVHTMKEISWRGGVQRFGNTYHFRTETAETFRDIAVVDRLIALERPLTAPAIKFIGGRTWGPTHTGDKRNSKMREVVERNLQGSGSATTNFYPELAVMVQWPLGRYGKRNRPQKLRKWLHTLNNQGLPLDGSRGMSAAPATLQAYIDGVTRLDLGIADLRPYELCTDDGEHIPIGPGTIYPFLEHRQLGR